MGFWNSTKRRNMHPLYIYINYLENKEPQSGNKSIPGTTYTPEELHILTKLKFVFVRSDRNILEYCPTLTAPLSNKNPISMYSEYDPQTQRHSRSKKDLFYLCCCLSFVAIAAATITALVLTLDNDDDRHGFIDRHWAEIFSGGYDEFFGEPPVSHHFHADKVYLARDDGSRLFVSKRSSENNTALIHVFDYNGTAWNGEWSLHSVLQAGSNIDLQEFWNMVVSNDGNRLAVSDFEEKVLVYRATNSS
jgi:hypothetical protein